MVTSCESRSTGCEARCNRLHLGAGSCSIAHRGRRIANSPITGLQSFTSINILLEIYVFGTPLCRAAGLRWPLNSSSLLIAESPVTAPSFYPQLYVCHALVLAGESLHSGQVGWLSGVPPQCILGSDCSRSLDFTASILALALPVLQHRHLCATA